MPVMHLHVFLIEIYPEVKLLGHRACVYSNTLVTAKAFFKGLCQFKYSQAVWESCGCSAFLPTLSIVHLFYYDHSGESI